jgi:RimJ/RimL family protein N-acetyltransferase
MGDGVGGDSAVVLTDGRVSLRPWSQQDAQFLVDASADPAIRRYNGSHDRYGHPAAPPTLAEARAAIDEFTRSWQAFQRLEDPSGVGFVIADADTGNPVGCCGVDNWTEEDVAQIGYWVAAPSRGYGYASRAVVLLTRWLFDLGAARVFLTVVAGNDGSVAVARRAGFVCEGRMRSHSVWQGERCDVLWFAALPQEWPMRSSPLNSA